MKTLYIFILLCLFGCGADSFVQEAKVQEKSGKNLNALVLYTRAIQQDSNYFDAFEGRAGVYLELKQYKEAGADFIKAAILSKNSIRTSFKTGYLYLIGAYAYMDSPMGCVENRDLIKDYFKEACKFGENDACSLDCSSTMTPSPVPTVTPSVPPPISNEQLSEEMLNQGRLEFSQRKFKEAKVSFEKALDLKPDNLIAKYNIASSFGALGEFETALKLFIEIEKIEPDLPYLYENIGLIYSYQGDCDNAGVYYSKINKNIPYCPRSFEAYNKYELGNIAFKENRLQDAVNEYSQALSLQPNYVEVKNNLASTYGALERFTESLKLYLEVEAEKPEFNDLYKNIATTYSFMGNCSVAEKYFKKAKIEQFSCPSSKRFKLNSLIRTR